MRGRHLEADCWVSHGGGGDNDNERVGVVVGSERQEESSLPIAARWVIVGRVDI